MVPTSKKKRPSSRDFDALENDEIEAFENQPSLWKWVVRTTSVVLVVTLVALWVVYR